MTRRQQQAGFTLIEVLVALAVLALALSAALVSAGALTRQAQRQTEALLAQICTDNAMSTMRLSQQLPGVGQSSVTCVQAQRTFEVQWTIQNTPNPSFRRIDVQVFEGGTSLLKTSTVLGRY